jgi:hypothetical protein
MKENETSTFGDDKLEVHTDVKAGALSFGFDFGGGALPWLGPNWGSSSSTTWPPPGFHW